MSDVSEIIKANNRNLAESLRRLAERVEQSAHAHHWHLSVSGGKPVRVSVASLDDPSGVDCGPIRTAVLIGDKQFVANMKNHLDNEQ